jgi:hypothetical protein
MEVPAGGVTFASFGPSQVVSQPREQFLVPAPSEASDLLRSASMHVLRLARGHRSNPRLA